MKHRSPEMNKNFGGEYKLNLFDNQETLSFESSAARNQERFF